MKFAFRQERNRALSSKMHYRSENALMNYALRFVVLYQWYFATLSDLHPFRSLCVFINNKFQTAFNVDVCIENGFFNMKLYQHSIWHWNCSCTKAHFFLLLFFLLFLCFRYFCFLLGPTRHLFAISMNHIRCWLFKNATTLKSIFTFHSLMILKLCLFCDLIIPPNQDSQF